MKAAILPALNEDLIIGKSSQAGYGRVALDDVNFHESCRMDTFERERVLLINPPDGEVTLMNYRIAENFQPPFKIFPFIDEQSANRIEVTIRLKAEFREPHFGSNVCARIPLPEKIGSVSAQLPVDAAGESTEYKGPEKCMYWFIKKFPGVGNKENIAPEHSMRIKIVLDSKADISACSREIGPISLLFEIPMFNCSGLAVKYLRVNEAGRDTKPNRWVRYITQSSSYGKTHARDAQREKKIQTDLRAVLPQCVGASDASQTCVKMNDEFARCASPFSPTMSARSTT